LSAGRAISVDFPAEKLNMPEKAAVSAAF